MIPVPGYKVTTEYRKNGTLWRACGWHTGVDFAAPAGTQVVAARGGKVKHTSYGSAFGSKQFAILCADGTEDFYAHTQTRPANGAVVAAGQPIAKVGALGSVTGPHLHFERHAKQGVWNCANMRNPQASLDEEAVVVGKVYLSKLKYGQTDSDSVRRLQLVLNKHSLQGGSNLPLSGNYMDQTDKEVRLCQQQHGFGNDPAGKSFVGKKQAEHLFAGSGMEIVDDTVPTPPPVPKPPVPALVHPDATWDPIEKADGGWFMGLRPFKGTAKKVTLHTTETSVKPNWFRRQKGIPHFTFDPASGALFQHLALDIACYTLQGGDNSPNSDSGVNIQIEMIGYTKDVPQWPTLSYLRIRDLLKWISENVGVPYEFPLDFPSARLDWAKWEPVSGIVGHLHAPYNDHTDPGALDVGRLEDFIPPDPDVPEFPEGTIGVKVETGEGTFYTYWPEM